MQSANIILIFWKVGDNGINVMYFVVQDWKVGLNNGLKKKNFWLIKYKIIFYFLMIKIIEIICKSLKLPWILLR